MLRENRLKCPRALAEHSNLSRRELMRAAAAVGLTTAMINFPGKAAQAQEPQKGGSLRLGVDGGATTDTLSPLVSLGADHVTNVALSVYDTLTEMDGDGNTQPSLAESIEGSKDGTWAIRLRKGVEFHDGKTLTANDVVWSLMLHKSEASKNGDARLIASNMSEIRTDGTDLVIIKQHEVNFDLPSHLSSFGLLIGKEGTEDWDACIGTGPYIKNEWQPGVLFTGKKFANFYRDDQGHFDSVSLINVTDPTARANGLLSGEFDVIGSPDINIAAQLPNLGDFRLISISSTQHYTTDMRTDSAPFTDANIRNAVKWAFKRQEIVDKVLGGHATVGNDIPLARTQKYYNDQLPQREYDPEKAKWYLKQAGVQNVDLVFHTSDGAFGGAVNMGLLMQESMRSAGINVKVERDPADGYWSNVWLKEPWCASYYNGRPTADWMLTSQYGSSAEWDATYFKNAKFDALLSAARSESDDGKRKELYYNAQELLWDNGGVAVLAFVNILIGAAGRLGHGKVGVNRRVDDSRLARRWWFES